MSFSAKQTIALEQEELEILDAIRVAAPKHHIKPKLAEAYGVWTVCFRRYCHEKRIPWLWMSSVSDFMDFLDAHPNVSPPERNRALDGIMFYISDVHESKEQEAADDDRSAIPSSTESLFARMLLRCNVQITHALRLRREDVHLDDATVTLPAGEGQESRTISLPSTLRDGFKQHVERVEDRTTSTNPLLFRHHKSDRDRTDMPADGDDDIERSTELATRVLKTFDIEKSASESSDQE